MMFAFGPFTVDVERRTVFKNGVPLRLTLRCIELLIAFVRDPGKNLSKQHLLDAAWPDPQASDATLAQHVFLLRRALRHEGIEWIRTIPNIGYIFTGKVCVMETGGERASALRTYIDGARTMRDIGSERALRSAIDLCTHALALDDASAAAYALRASCWRLLAESLHAEPLPCLQSAKADALEALAHRPDDADACIEAALSAALLDRDAAAAQRHFNTALRCAPNHPALARTGVWIALMDGRTDEALRIGRDVGGAVHAAALYMAHDFSGARAILERWPESDLAARVIRGACRLFERDFGAALLDFHAVYYADADTDAGGVPSVRQYALGLYIYTLAKMGCTQAARDRARGLERLKTKRYVSPMARAAAYLGLGDHARALGLIDEALQRFDPWSAYVLVDPLLDEVRECPEFSALASNAA